MNRSFCLKAKKDSWDINFLVFLESSYPSSPQVITKLVNISHKKIKLYKSS